jgi:uncharacterized protein (DUF58 family)
VTRDSAKFLQPEQISRISRLEVRAREIVEGFLSGLHRSPYYGQSVEFVQHREYVPGDDFRRIDWKAWSKTDKYYIKQYEEDTNLRTLLLVDVSESMNYGSGAMTKYDYACTVAAALSYLLLRQSDAVALTTFDNAIRSRVPPRSRQSHLHSIVEALQTQKPGSKTGLDRLLAQVANEQSLKGMIILISDLFVDPQELDKGLSLLRHRGHDVLVFHILDDEELDFDFSGTTKFEGLEAAGDVVCDPRALREGYLAALTQFLDTTRRNCARRLIDYQTIRTSEHLDAALAHYLNHRIGMQGSALR